MLWVRIGSLLVVGEGARQWGWGLSNAVGLPLNTDMAESETSTNPRVRIGNFCPSDCSLQKTGK